MLIVTEPGISKKAFDALIEEIKRQGYTPHVSQGEAHTLIGAIGAPPTPELMEHFRALPGVEQVIRISKPYKLASWEVHPEPSVIAFPTGKTGDGHFMVAAGPCGVESREQILTAARYVKKHGAQMLRGGAFKPRTSPYAFQGLGVEGLKLLAEARGETGLPVVTEVTSPNLVDVVAEYADVLQIGARNAQNFALLKAAGGAGKPVLLKRGMSMTLDEFLMAAEYILSEGNPNVVLVERGIRTFEKSTRFTLDVSAVPVLKAQTHLPVWIDPSHAAGKRAYVQPLALAGIAAGADGIIVETHPNPEQAKSDAAQQLHEEEFATLMEAVRRLLPAVDKTIAVPA
ncbi:3-deoxy-7-phosphoheptulonate synthase [Oceanithermus sp.]